MTDLTGAELALAVARVMGRDKALIGLPGVVMDIDLDDWPAYEAQKWHLCWRPDTGGAAAWEVLEWVRQQGWDVGLRCVELCLDSDEPVTESVLCTLRATRPVRECQAIGPTDAIALCRAVVALGRLEEAPDHD